MSDIKEVIIIGSGPSGHTAAIYASRANLKPVILEGAQPGGQLTTTTEVDNFPGFPEGITGPELMENMKKQAQRFGSEYLPEIVTKADLSARPFTLSCDSGRVFQANSIIISTGASAKYLGLPNEMELIGKGVSACATCDGFFYKDQVVHVVGGGDTAMEEANFLTKFASKVYLIHRSENLRASKPMQKLCMDNPKIEFLYNKQVVEIVSDSSGVTDIVVEDTQNGSKETRKTDGLFMAIGHNPNSGFLNGQINLDEHGFIKTINDSPDTNIKGVFACGDIQDPYYRQAISAAGSGCMAAIRAEKFLNE